MGGMGKKMMILVAALTLSGGAAVAMVGPSVVSAQSEPSTDAPAAGRDGPVARALSGLVDDGTLTQAQADAVVERLRAERPDRAGHGRGDRRANRRVRLREAAGVAAETIGITTDELRTAVQDGQTVAEVAEANDVDPQIVIDALVEHATTKIDQAVADGRIDEARADEIKAHLPDMADRFVNHERR